MSPHENLRRAREALARARDGGADPWRVAELQLRYDAALAVALDSPDVDDGDGPPRPRRGRGGA